MIPEKLFLKGDGNVGDGRWFEWTMQLSGRVKAVRYWGCRMVLLTVDERTFSGEDAGPVAAGSTVFINPPIDVSPKAVIRLEVVVQDPSAFGAELDYDTIVVLQ